MIRIVTGPPGSGKTTFVNDTAKPGDIVIDMDAIAGSLWFADTTQPHDYPSDVREIARAARNAAVSTALRVAQGKRYLTVWIIHADPNQQTLRQYRAANAKFTELNPGLQTCLERIAQRGPRVARYLEPVVRNWYERQR